MGIRAKLVLYAFLTSVFLTQAVCLSKTASANESNQTNIKSNTIQDLSIFDSKGAYAKDDLNNLDSTGLREIIKKELAQGQENNSPVPAKETSKNKNLPKGKFTINASAYTAAADECGKSDGITASGAKVKEKETIACPKSFAFGTKINIEGYGTYICQDRGGAIKGNKIDIYVETKKEAFAFGRQQLVAEIIE